MKKLFALVMVAFCMLATSSLATAAQYQVLTESATNAGVTKSRSIDSLGVLTESTCVTSPVTAAQKCVSQTAKLDKKQAERMKLTIQTSQSAMTAHAQSGAKNVALTSTRSLGEPLTVNLHTFYRGEASMDAQKSSRSSAQSSSSY